MLTKNIATPAAESTSEKSVELTVAGVVLLATLRQVKKIQAYYGSVVAEIEKAFKAAMGDAEVALVDGEPVLTYRTTLRTALSQKKLKADYPVTALMCMVSKPVRTFQLLDK